MIYSRLFLAVCTGIVISTVTGGILYYIPVLNNFIVSLLIFVFSYGAAGMISSWANREHPFLAATIAAVLLCTFQHAYTVLFVSRVLIYTPFIFAVSICLAIVMSNIGVLAANRQSRNFLFRKEV